MTKGEIHAEFDRQVNNLIQNRYPLFAGISDNEFLKLFEPLKVQLENLNFTPVNVEEGKLPFVIVIKSDLVPTTKAMSVANKDGKEGITKLNPHEPSDFQIIESVLIPNNVVYVISNIDRGRENINLAPSEAIKIILSDGRSPLTIDEGVAIVTHFPEFLMKNNCFSLLASRHGGDKRVPAIWINAQKHPNLGWCWEGNPHTWLGSASCKERIW